MMNRSRVRDLFVCATAWDMTDPPQHSHLNQVRKINAREFDDWYSDEIREAESRGQRNAAKEIRDALPNSPSKAQTDRMKYAIGFLEALAGPENDDD